MLKQWGQQATASLRLWAFPTAECEAKGNDDANVKGMLDPDRLERAAKAVRDIDKSPNAKNVRVPSQNACYFGTRPFCMKSTYGSVRMRARVRWDPTPSSLWSTTVFPQPPHCRAAKTATYLLHSTASPLASKIEVHVSQTLGYGAGVRAAEAAGALQTS